MALIEKLNADPKINGILVQSPLPKHLNEALIVEHIDPKRTWTRSTPKMSAVS